MSRFILAFVCFFRLLFTGKLPASAAPRLPAEALPRLGAPTPEPDVPDVIEREPGKAFMVEPAATKAEAHSATSPAAAKPAVAKPAVAVGEAHREGALALLGLLQREARLVDFLQEDLDEASDEQIGAVVRDIHRSCKKVLADHVKLEAVMPGEEDAAVTVPRGFDPIEVKLVGAVDGQPPFKGVMRHHGWRAVDVHFPELSEGIDRHVLAPAEVEISG